MSRISPLDRRQRAFKADSVYDFRVMVEGLESDDLELASSAYDRMVGSGPFSEGACDDPLSRIGVSLDRGDLAAARHTLNAIEAKALRMLRGLKECTRSLPEPSGAAVVTLN